MQRFLLQPEPEVALAAVRSRLDVSRESPIGLVFAYIELARKLDGYCRGIAAKENPMGLAGKLKLWGPAAQSIPHAARRLNKRQTADLLAACVEVDARCKSGRGDPERLLEALTVRFVQVAGGAAS